MLSDRGRRAKSNLGRLFGYKGHFAVEWRRVSNVPETYLPRRTERRE
jgi:hypothetical protein